MAEVNGPNLAIFCVCSTTSLVAIVYHAIRYDRGKCLIPTKKDWFRCLLMHMLLFSNICLVAWSISYAWIKYSLGWVTLGPAGARPWPSMLFPEEYAKWNSALVVLLGVTYSLQASLNAEEGFYWYHLMRAVRRPQAAVPFLKSWFFYSWIAVSVAVTVVQIAVPWIGYKGNMQSQLSVELLCSAIAEIVVLVASSMVVLAFPRFLEDVKASGAGPEVRARLHYYHSLNRIRTLFRFTFVIPILLYGADGLTKKTPINLSPMASDCLATITIASLSIVMVISAVLYLPRSSPSASNVKVMVGQHPPRPFHDTQILTLLREGGGQWDGVDEDLRGSGKEGRINDAPFANADMRRMSWNRLEGEEKGYSQSHVPALLGNFTSPIVVSTEAQPQRPVEIRMQIERQVHED